VSRTIHAASDHAGLELKNHLVEVLRAALCHDVFSARMTRAHNDANILCMGARVVGIGVAEEVATAFFGGAFEGGRHARRVGKIEPK
jgi:ribose 5-phosphate isomerase B